MRFFPARIDKLYSRIYQWSFFGNRCFVHKSLLYTFREHSYNQLQIGLESHSVEVIMELALSSISHAAQLWAAGELECVIPVPLQSGDRTAAQSWFAGVRPSFLARTEQHTQTRRQSSLVPLRQLESQPWFYALPRR